MHGHQHVRQPDRFEFLSSISFVSSSYQVLVRTKERQACLQRPQSSKQSKRPEDHWFSATGTPVATASSDLAGYIVSFLSVDASSYYDQASFFHGTHCLSLAVVCCTCFVSNELRALLWNEQGRGRGWVPIYSSRAGQLEAGPVRWKARPLIARTNLATTL
jgi:hypothetical protein